VRFRGSSCTPAEPQASRRVSVVTPEVFQGILTISGIFTQSSREEVNAERLCLSSGNVREETKCWVEPICPWEMIVTYERQSLRG